MIFALPCGSAVASPWVRDSIGGLSSCRRHGLNVAQDMVLGFKMRANGASPVGTTEPNYGHQPSPRDLA